MELFSGGSGSKGGSLYISATKENELSKATLQIIQNAKARSKKGTSQNESRNAIAVSGASKSMNQSMGQSVMFSTFKKKATLKDSLLSKSNKPSLLPPVVPSSTKSAL